MKSAWHTVSASQGSVLLSWKAANFNQSLLIPRTQHDDWHTMTIELGSQRQKLSVISKQRTPQQALIAK